MPIRSPQPLATFEDVDNTVTVQMAENGSVAGLSLTVEITENEGNTVVTTRPVTVLNAGSSTTKAQLSFTFAPDLQSLTPGGGYKYWVRVNNTGSRDVLAWGAIQVRNRTD